MLKSTLQHYLNPLHVYCRLVNLKLNRKWAKRICQLYERNIYKYPTIIIAIFTIVMVGLLLTIII